MIRSFDDKGRIVIPKEMRDVLGSTEVYIEQRGNCIVLSKPKEMRTKKEIQDVMKELKSDGFNGETYIQYKTLEWVLNKE